MPSSTNPRTNKSPPTNPPKDAWFLPEPTFVDFLSRKWHDESTSPQDPRVRIVGEVVRCPYPGCKEEIDCTIKKDFESYTREEYVDHYAEAHNI